MRVVAEGQHDTVSVGPICDSVSRHPEATQSASILALCEGERAEVLTNP